MIVGGIDAIDRNNYPMLITEYEQNMDWGLLAIL
jgi:hypothetical protein